jgi:hypothetical protein
MFNKPSIPKQYAEHHAVEIFWPYPKNLRAGTTQKCKIEKTQVASSIQEGMNYFDARCTFFF